MAEHWSGGIVEDLIGAFKIFVAAAVLIFAALAIAKTLYPSFPLDNSSYWIVAIILGFFLTLISYYKSRVSFR
jgi:hypothetical protein